METNVSFTITYVYEGEGKTYCTIQKKTTNQDGTATYSAEDKELVGENLQNILDIVESL